MRSEPLTGAYANVYQYWRDEPEQFWLEAAAAIDWIVPPTRAFAPEAGIYGRWFPDAICNTCHNAVDRHVAAGHGARVALIHDSPVSGVTRHLSYAELLREVQALALVLARHGIGKGDRVLIYMPMVPEAIIAMLAVARLGAIHAVVFGGFAAPELATRIDDAQPSLVLTASCGIELQRIVPYKPLLDAAIGLAAHPVPATIVLQRPQCEARMVPGRDHDWEHERAWALAELERGVASPCVPVAATDPLYLLHTSGTTGRPKGVVRDNGGHMVALAWSMRHLYGVEAGEVFWAASDIGWVVGHSYIAYGPLLAGCTSVLYEGKPVGTPDAGAYWRVIEQHRVKVLFTAPTAFRAIRKEDPGADLLVGRDLSHFEALYLAGERADPDTLRWAQSILHRPVIDHWWQTETGWAIAGNPRGIELLPIAPGALAAPMPGYALACLDEDGLEVPAGTMGTVAIKLPLPPGALPTLWNQDARFKEGYLAQFPGYYTTSDAGIIAADGSLMILGRTDDIINVAGHRLSTGAMEEILASHPAVAECAVVGIADALKGEVPCGFLVLKSGVTTIHETIVAEVVRAVRETIGPVAAFKLALVVARLPKTRSGKILRATMKKIADGDAWTLPPTIDDPSVLDDIARAVSAARQAQALTVAG